MTAVFWVLLAFLGLVAGAAFGLVMVVARRLRALTEHVHRYLPVSEHGLPDPGTPLPRFAATTASGRRVTESHFAGEDRVLAFLTTDCGSCHDQIPAVRDLASSGWPEPVAVVIGPKPDRAEMVAKLGPEAIVLEEDERGPIAEAFEVHEFPAILVAGSGVVRTSAHGVARVLAAAKPADGRANDPAGNHAAKAAVNPA
jgi:peroxiredoxin